MIFSIQNVINSIAGQLATIFPDGDGGCKYPIYQSPTYDTEYPCFYVFLMPSNISDELSGVQAREIALDIVYVQQRNSVDQNYELIAVLEALDIGMDMLAYTDGNITWPLHILNRNASIEDQELHYKITIKERVSLESIVAYMQTMEEANVEIKDYY